MALFGSKKEVKEKKVATKKDVAVKAVKEKAAKVAKPAVISAPSASPASYNSLSEVILRPHITEKSGIASQGGVYTFEVTRYANKPNIAKAIRAMYKVTPVKIGVINVPAKQVFLRGRKGTVAGMRKAIVTVKKGEKIDFV